jgi:hypothetical protein
MRSMVSSVFSSRSCARRTRSAHSHCSAWCRSFRGIAWREGLGAALVLASVVITLRRSHRASRPAPVRDGEMPQAEMLPENADALSRR